jgi:hypothetical protein
MNARGRPGSRPPLKSGSHTETRFDSSGPHDAVHDQIPSLTLWPLNLDLATYRVAVSKGVVDGILTRPEADALVSVAERVPTIQGDLVSAFHEMLRELAASTAPRRARMLALWTYCDPAALERATWARVPMGTTS